MKIYIIVATLGVGGAEKRFSELWIYMKKNKNLDISLVMPLYTYKIIKESKCLSSLENFESDIIFLPWQGGSYIKLRKILKQFMEEKGTNDIFHFVLSFPIFSNFFNKYKTIYTYPSTSFKQLNIKGLFTAFLSFFESTKIDFLDPSLTLKIKRTLFWKQEHITNTPGSFVDSKYYKAQNIKNKNNMLVFLGRFEEVKQVTPFVEAIPTIDKTLKANGIDDHEFLILGYGSLESRITSFIKNNKDFQDIKLKIYFEKEPVNVLKYSKIFYSLQKHTNYPSKSLLEALSCGNIPIVTDNRDTRKIAPPSFSYYVNEAFSKEEISERTLDILTLSDEEFEKKTQLSLDFISKNFSIESSVEYYTTLYKYFMKV